MTITTEPDDKKQAVKTLYDILEISKDADQEAIKKAYKRLALLYHPDKNDNDPTCAEKFREVNRAYQILSNPDRRKFYDRYGASGIRFMEQCDHQNIDVTKFMNNPFLFYGSLVTFFLTGCCFGCCCCCNFFFNFCCGFCCGYCKPKEADYQNFHNADYFANENNQDFDDTVENNNAVIDTQPEMNETQ